jgi:ArsR family transcriptional regulator
MKTDEAVEGLGSLAQGTRLSIYRLLVKRGPEGLAAGAIAEALDVPGSSLSFHLYHLMRAGLITQKRRSRELIYAAHFDRMNALVAFLTENCCGGASYPPVCDVPGQTKVASRRQSGRARRRIG